MPLTTHLARRMAALLALAAAAIPGVAATTAQARAPHHAAAKIHRVKVHRVKAHKVHHAKASKRAKARAKARRHRAFCRTHHHSRRCARVSLVLRRADVIAPKVSVIAPGDRATIAPGTTVCSAKASDDRRITFVNFYLDQVKIAQDKVVPYQCRFAARPDNRTHTLSVVAADAAGHRTTAKVTFRVAAPAPTPPAPTSSPAPPASKTVWSDSFEEGNFTKWSWWGQDDPSYGHRSVVDCQSQGIPALNGTHVARFQTTADDIANGRIHAKLLQWFGTNHGDMASARPPADVSGTYTAWYYLPKDYTVPADTWVNIFQFKEEYRTGRDSETADPMWWIQLNDGTWGKRMALGSGEAAPDVSRPDAPVAFVNRWQNDWKVHRNYMAVPLGRWFEVKAVVRQHDRIDFYMDGKLLDTGYAKEYPVGPQHGSASMDWQWGIGNYSTGANGPLYADDVSYTKL